MVDLISKIPEHDKVVMNNYIYHNGISKDNFIGLDEWLRYWSHSKQVLYKLLGNSFDYVQNFSYQKSKNELMFQINKFLNDSDFIRHYRRLIHELLNEDIINEDTRNRFYDMSTSTYVISGKYEGLPVKIRKKGGNRELRFQEGTKIMRAYSQLLKYFEPEIKEFDKIGHTDLFKEFEDFRVKYSILVNDREIKGKLHISIHPMDFMTMSDNNSNWHSCTSWICDGTDKAGTIEMMNSNNVVCCYITSNKSNFCFGFDGDSDYTWNNKRWRQLFIVTKDIIVSGRPYPFASDGFTENILKIIKKLAKKNLNWDYKYGIEPYLDMKHIHSEYTMNRAKEYVKNDPRKKNILFASNGMFNDYIAKSNINWLCYRNKVDKTKIISYSGKSCCLCCGGPITRKIETEEEYEDFYFEYEEWPGYNDRYKNTEHLLCEDCLKL